MKKLHLIIHKDCLDINDKAEKKTIERIREIESTESWIKYVSANEVGLPFESFENVPCGGEVDREKVRRTIEGYETIILYGRLRSVCVEFAAEAILNEGMPVAYDIRGTA
jgi:hypothetical protein